MKGVNIAEGKQGVALIQKFSIDEEQARKSNMYRMLDREPYFTWISKGDYTKLYVNGELMMSDTPMEKRTNEDFIRNAKGDILIGGLGIGLLIENLKDKIASGEVTSVTIVEKYQDVIDLVAPNYNIPQIHIECADIFNYDIRKEEKYDAIYFDIWPTISGDNYPDMKKLKAKYRRCKRDKESYIGCWLEDYCRKRYLADRREEKHSKFWF